MSWENTLTSILECAGPIAEAIAGGQMTAEGAWSHPAVKDLRERLMREVGGEGKIEDLLEAGRQLRAQHAKLLKKEELSAQDLARLGVLSAASYQLSSDALARASSGKALFLYTMKQLMPWLKRAADLALLIAQGSSGSQDRCIDLYADTDSWGSPQPEPPPREIADLITTARVLAQLLARREGLDTSH